MATGSGTTGGKLTIELDPGVLAGIDERAELVGDTRNDMITRLIKIGMSTVSIDTTAREEVGAPTKK